MSEQVKCEAPCPFSVMKMNTFSACNKLFEFVHTNCCNLLCSKIQRIFDMSDATLLLAPLGRNRFQSNDKSSYSQSNRGKSAERTGMAFTEHLTCGDY